MINPAHLPRLVAVRQLFPPGPVIDPAEALRAAFHQHAPLARLAPGSRIAVAVGSRGIRDLTHIVRATVDLMRQAGHRPFLVPAMGSHGGATPEGQVRLLAELGVVPEDLDVPITAGMETVILGEATGGTEVHCAAAAAAADAILLINRVKPHTDFGGPLGSGLLKMIVVGLGKHRGALAFHRAAPTIGYDTALRAMAHVALDRLPLLGGVAIVENQRHAIARVEFVHAAGLFEAEERLGAEARRLMATLPAPELDLLIVDRLGKDVSGAGMDPNVIGRSVHGYSILESDMPAHPRIRRIFVRHLTPRTRGNAIGIGLADFTTTRLARAVDLHVTYTNALTALSFQAAKIPVHFDTDRQAIEAALSTLSLSDPRAARVARIADTLSLEHLQISEACLAELRGRTDIAVSGAPEPMTFDAQGNLPEWRESP